MASDILSFIAIISFWGWVTCFFLFIFRSFTGYGVFSAKQALIWGGASVFCAFVWIFALRNI